MRTLKRRAAQVLGAGVSHDPSTDGPRQFFVEIQDGPDAGRQARVSASAATARILADNLLASVDGDVDRQVGYRLDWNTSEVEWAGVRPPANWRTVDYVEGDDTHAKITIKRKYDAYRKVYPNRQVRIVRHVLIEQIQSLDPSTLEG